MTEVVIAGQQGSAAWFAARCGRLTASRIGEATKRVKGGGWGAGRRNVMGELVSERLTGQAADHYVSPAMQWGLANEAAAVQGYEFLTGAVARETGFIPHPTIRDSGASPDRLIGDDGLLEAKCPITVNHIATLLAGMDAPGYVPEEYLPQIHWQMACTGRPWANFISFDPRMPAHLQVYIARIARDEAVIAALEADARVFLDELDAQVERLHALYDRVAA